LSHSGRQVVELVQAFRLV